MSDTYYRKVCVIAPNSYGKMEVMQFINNFLAMRGDIVTIADYTSQSKDMFAKCYKTVVEMFYQCMDDLNTKKLENQDLIILVRINEATSTHANALFEKAKQSLTKAEIWDFKRVGSSASFEKVIHVFPTDEEEWIDEVYPNSSPDNLRAHLIHKFYSILYG